MSQTPDMNTLPTQLDVLIIGAGISGVGAACHLQQQCPGKRFALVEAQASFGGTWRTHSYPGTRSDSDLFTFGYRFKPWRGDPIATADQILKYMDEVISEHHLGGRIHYSHRVLSACWSTPEACWHVEIQDTPAEGNPVIRSVRCNFLWMCQGYYRHAEGYTPDWPGMADFAGRIVHPQQWPQDLDLSDQRVVVIGSGATAATLLPALAGSCQHVTMLQRSPTWFATGRNANELADTLRALDIPHEWTHEIVRRKVLHDQALIQQRCVQEPDAVAAELLAGVREALGPEHAHLADVHFKPSYRPWQQRLAFVPNGDLFKAVRTGQASVVTGQIDRFVPEGIRLSNGDIVPADVIVTATGFNLNVLGDIHFQVDCQPLDFARSVTWRGAMFTGLPNLVWVFGYFRASWTLRADLLGDFVCKLLLHMDTHGIRSVVPQLRPQDQGMTLAPWVRPDNFNPGYLARSIHQLPRQGDHAPWVHLQDYRKEKDDLPAAALDDGSLIFS
jgi:cation diffusion facilitator CzcD-associated flavoprotein CzcO